MTLRGQTWILAGDPAARVRVRPLQGAVSRRIFEFGDEPNAPNAIKLAGNFLIGAAIERCVCEPGRRPPCAARRRGPPRPSGRGVRGEGAASKSCVRTADPELDMTCESRLGGPKSRRTAPGWWGQDENLSNV